VGILSLRLIKTLSSVQLIWISGSTSSVRKINISRQRLIRWSISAGVLLIMLGVSIHFFGFRIALQFQPKLARTMGDVITADEQQAVLAQHQQQLARLTQQHQAALDKRAKELAEAQSNRIKELAETDAQYQKQLERVTQTQQTALAQREKKQKDLVASYEHQLALMHVDFKETTMQFSREKKEIDGLYRKKLEALNVQMTGMTSKIGELNALKERLATLAAPAPVKNKMSDASGRGGPLRPVVFKSAPNAYLEDELDYTIAKISALNTTALGLRELWATRYQLLTHLPLGAPLPMALGLNSNFGPRVDPITRTVAQHSGIDFVAKVGTPILASGNGTISRAGWDGAYGLTVEIKHAEGYVSKYAHASKIEVAVGQTVTRGQKIAEVGLTGRTTGAHLHFEVLYNGQLVNPMQVLVVPGSKQNQPK
jgi:murein DD-endopeptidase MepM/ murein hydrolase activator NlpD